MKSQILYFSKDKTGANTQPETERLAWAEITKITSSEQAEAYIQQSVWAVITEETANVPDWLRAQIHDRSVLSCAIEPSESDKTGYLFSQPDLAACLNVLTAYRHVSLHRTADGQLSHLDERNRAVRRAWRSYPGDLTDLLPTQLKHRLTELFGDQALRSMTSWLSATKKMVRVNTTKIDDAQFLDWVKQQNWQAIPAGIPHCFYITDRSGQPPRLTQNQNYRDGEFYIQSFPSALPALALELQLGQKALDLCAAPGSKTTQMAELVGRTGHVTAVDVSEDRVSRVAESAQRLGLDNIEIEVTDGNKFGEKHLGQYDAVLIDAPCSNSGSIATNPVQALIWSENTLADSAAVQLSLLESGWLATKNGGSLVYSTCSLDPEENEMVVDQFLKMHPEAEVLPVKIPNLVSVSGLTQWRGHDLNTKLELAIRLRPYEHFGLGFFLIKLGKK